MAEVNEKRAPLPSNSKTKNHPKLDPVVSGETAVQVPNKGSLGKRIVKLFVTADMEDIKQYAIHEILIPGIKNATLDILARMFFGSGTYGTYTAYQRANSTQRRSQSTVRQSNTSLSTTPARATYFADTTTDGLKDVIFTHRDDAVNVLTALNEQVAAYGEATVMQYYDLAKLSSEFTDDSWGWTDLRGSTIRTVRGGYLISLPRPIQLDLPF